MTMRKEIQLAVLALAALTVLTACTGAREADRRLVEPITLQPGDLGPGWRTLQEGGCLQRATVCIERILVTRPPRSGTAIARTAFFRTPEAAIAAHKRTLGLLPPLGGSEALPTAMARRIRRRNEHYSARVITRSAMTAGRASAVLVVERRAITGGADATHYDAELLYITDQKINMTVIVAPRRLLRNPSQLLARLASRIEASRA
jgi:hypothetical protein